MKTYSPKKIQWSFNGVPISGFAQGTFVKVSHTADAFTPDIGSDGEVARVASADESGSIVLTLQQTSASNDMLSDALALDRLLQTGTGVLHGVDAGGRTAVLGAEAWVQKSADIEFADGKSAREWTIFTGILKTHVGGN